MGCHENGGGGVAQPYTDGKYSFEEKLMTSRKVPFPVIRGLVCTTHSLLLRYSCILISYISSNSMKKAERNLSDRVILLFMV